MLMVPMVMVLITVCCLMFSISAQPTIQDRASDPKSFSNGPVLPFPIGIPTEVTNDVVGKPLTNDEFLYPPLIVDPPLHDESRKDPIEAAGLFEGDIIVKSVDEFLAITDQAKPHMRNAVISEDKLWSKGIVPYALSSNFDRYERGAIAFAMKEFHDNTCIRFRSRDAETDYIHIIKADGCSSSVGKIGGLQVVSLGNGCLTKGVVIHELMHTVGFWHEQARPDRDNYVTIVWSNIQPGMEYNFGKYDWTYIQNLTVEYDLGSIMHYGSNAFANVHGKPTIVPNHGGEIGQRYGMSEKDILKINMLYKCKNNGGEIVSEVTGEDLLPGSTTEKKECTFWAKHGECQTNRNYMTTYCSSACKKYGNNGNSTENDCQDQNSSCPKWAANGQCDANPGYMLVYCKSSCKACQAKTKRFIGRIREGILPVFYGPKTRDIIHY